MEVLAFRRQITVLKRQTHRPKLRPWDRGLWMILKKAWPNWKTPLMIFRPETVIGWQRAGFRMFWRWKSRWRRGRPGKDLELIQLIRRMRAVNPTWGSPRIRDELAKLGPRSLRHLHWSSENPYDPRLLGRLLFRLRRILCHPQPFDLVPENAVFLRQIFVSC
jgi:hypothetical protein